MDAAEKIEILHTQYALRVALSCILGSMTKEQKREVASKMAQHLVVIEESRDVGMDGAQQLLTTMEEVFQSIHMASQIQPTFS